ncbi:MAG: hypothetical protein IPQ07_20810 [Myxococcales bacterium]|nr:hypothetical protein [Myxococcales bacterium]
MSLALLLWTVESAVADPTPPPWVAGVSEQQKTTAHERLEEGNALFLDHKYAAALGEYERAVAAWDHPAIRFNIVRCLIQLDKPVEAFDNLTLALKYGAAPLEDAVFAEATSYQKLLANQIGELEVVCDQAGVAVTLDGRSLLTCPGTKRTRMVPGEHQLVGSKTGFATRTIGVVVLGGKQQRQAVELDSLARTARITRRWGTWMPWTVFGGGITLTAFGTLVELKASSDFAAFDQRIQRDCAKGCEHVDFGPRQTAQLENRIGIGTLVVGVATVAAGSVLIYLNRARTTYPTEIDVRPTQHGGVFTIAGQF